VVNPWSIEVSLGTGVVMVVVQMLVWGGVEDIQVRLPAFPPGTRSNRLALAAGSRVEAEGSNLTESESEGERDA